MHAMILAAGRGERMMPLTKDRPKPMLEVIEKPLIEHQLEKLCRAGFREIVINLGWLGDQIETYLGNGDRFGCHILYSDEGGEVLETGGGILKAMPLISSDTFLVVNADVWSEYDYSRFQQPLEGLAHLVLVDNPDHNQQGDFGLEGSLVSNSLNKSYTFSGIGVYSKALFLNEKNGRFPLAPLLRQAAEQGQVTGELYSGQWLDIGTPDRLQQLNYELNSRNQT